MRARVKIKAFELENLAYVGRAVHYFKADENGRPDFSHMLNLYRYPWGSERLTNPQILGSKGMFRQPVYADDDPVAVLSTLRRGDCLPNGMSGVPDQSVPDCMVPDYLPADYVVGAP